MIKVQPAVRRETRNVALTTLIGVGLMIGVFSVLNMFFPDSVPFDYKVVISGLGAGIVAILNFFLMGLAVQKIAVVTDEKQARRMMQKSYYTRFGLQVLWIIAVIAAPCFNIVAGLIPLMFPGLGIRLRGILAHIFPKLAPKIGIGDDPVPGSQDISDAETASEDTLPGN